MTAPPRLVPEKQNPGARRPAEPGGKSRWRANVPAQTGAPLPPRENRVRRPPRVDVLEILPGGRGSVTSFSREPGSRGGKRRVLDARWSGAPLRTDGRSPPPRVRSGLLFRGALCYTARLLPWSLRSHRRCRAAIFYSRWGCSWSCSSRIGRPGTGRFCGTTTITSREPSCRPGRGSRASGRTCMRRSSITPCSTVRFGSSIVGLAMRPMDIMG